MTNPEIDKAIHIQVMGGVETDAIPQYTLSICAAWKIVEKLGLAYFRIIHDPQAGAWYCRFGQGKWEEIIAESAPMAISLAACELSEIRTNLLANRG